MVCYGECTTYSKAYNLQQSKIVSHKLTTVNPSVPLQKLAQYPFTTPLLYPIIWTYTQGEQPNEPHITHTDDVEPHTRWCGSDVIRRPQKPPRVYQTHQAYVILTSQHRYTHRHKNGEVTHILSKQVKLSGLCEYLTGVYNNCVKSLYLTLDPYRRVQCLKLSGC